jgi:glyoxylase-like metal-dependent hydrolase (beta-lactamase superfamily II)
VESWRSCSYYSHSDSYIQASYEGSLRNVAKEDAIRLQGAAHRVGAPRYTLNAFLIEGESHKPILIDTGLGKFGGEAAGHLLESLALTGVRPEQFGTVLMTHLHLDHSGGLITKTGTRAFPNAQLWVHGAEVDFWLKEGAEHLAE